VCQLPRIAKPSGTWTLGELHPFLSNAFQLPRIAKPSGTWKLGELHPFLSNAFQLPRIAKPSGTGQPIRPPAAAVLRFNFPG
jgi:hypothetical protein